MHGNDAFDYDHKQNNNSSRTHTELLDRLTPEADDAADCDMHPPSSRASQRPLPAVASVHSTAPAFAHARAPTAAPQPHPPHQPHQPYQPHQPRPLAHLQLSPQPALPAGSLSSLQRRVHALQG